MLRKETLEEMRRKRHAYPHEVIELVDEVLALREKHDRGQLIDLKLDLDTKTFLSDASIGHRAEWAKNLIMNLAALPYHDIAILILNNRQEFVIRHAPKDT